MNTTIPANPGTSALTSNSARPGKTERESAPREARESESVSQENSLADDTVKIDNTSQVLQQADAGAVRTSLNNSADAQAAVQNLVQLIQQNPSQTAAAQQGSINPETVSAVL